MTPPGRHGRQKNPISGSAPRTTADVLRTVERRFRRAKLHFGHGTENARDEAAWLVAHVLRVAPSRLSSRLDQPVRERQAKKIEALAAARIGTRKPLAYLLREAWFAGLRFYIDERAIVPRSLTGEFIQERLQPWIEVKRVHRILDLCTGGGCMAVACARAFPRARVDAADISDDALAVARFNVGKHRLGKRVRLIRSDLFGALRGKRYDLIVTNPPYVGRAEMKTLPPEYRHEPALALASGTQGLDAITRILAHAPKYLAPGGILVAEVGNSAAALQEKFPSVPFVWLATTTGDESVFLITAEELNRYRRAFMNAN